MALSRSARITLLLAIDILFFFIELVAGTWQPPPCLPPLISLGYAVGSLALVADSFHMLKYVAFPRSSPHSPSRSDVMSLIVALYAIRVCILVAFIATRLILHTSSPVKTQVIPGTPTAGTEPRSLPPSLMVFSCWHSASLSRWKLWNASSPRRVCTTSLCRQSPPLISHRHIKPSSDSCSRIFRLGV